MAVVRPNLASARGVTLTRIRQDTTTIPTNAVVNANFGENISGGPLSDVIFRVRYDTNAGGNPCACDISGLIQNINISLNGETIHQFNGFANDITVDSQVGLYGYFLNSIGGSFSESSYFDANRRTGFFRVPMGIVLPQGTSRIEVSITYIAGAAATSVADGSDFEMWAVYNTSMTESLYTPVSTSSVMAVGQSQVTVRIPSRTGYVCSGIMMLSQNTAAPNALADNLGPNGVVVTSIGPYGLDQQLLRFLNGNLNGEIDVPSTVTAVSPTGAGAGALIPAVLGSTQATGATFIPVFGLTSDADITLLVDTANAQTNRIFIPILTARVGASLAQQPTQTQQVKGSLSAQILDRVDV